MVNGDLFVHRMDHIPSDRGSHPAKKRGRRRQGTHDFDGEPLKPETSGDSKSIAGVLWDMAHNCHDKDISAYLTRTPPCFGPILTSRNALKDALKGPEAQSEELVGWSGRNWWGRWSSSIGFSLTNWQTLYVHSITAVHIRERYNTMNTMNITE